jgi:DNA-binding transcriptional regulator GbsR (MarR family)
MHAAILFDTTEYLDQMVWIIDSEERKNFIDTSLIIAPPMAMFDPLKGKYVGHDPVLINNTLHRDYLKPEYNTLTASLKKHIEFFSENIADLIDIDFMISPSVYKELGQSERYMKNKHNDRIKNLHAMSKPIKIYVQANGNNRRHKAEYRKKHINERFSREKDIREYMDRLFFIEHKLAKEIKVNSSKYMDALRQIKLENQHLYYEIYKTVSKAFEEYKIEKLKSLKNHDNSKDHKILSEIILYSHISGEKTTFFTGDSDFYGITKFLNGKNINTEIRPDVTVVQKMMQLDPNKMPYFKRTSDIRYDKKFLIERY